MGAAVTRLNLAAVLIALYIAVGAGLAALIATGVGDMVALRPGGGVLPLRDG
jgi:hypothetical protein